MTDRSNNTAAQVLVAARIEGRKIDRLPEGQRPSTDNEALAIQRSIVDLLQTTIAGWKCSPPRGENLFVAPLPASTIQNSSPCPIKPERGVARIEPEIAFVLGRDLPPRSTPYSETEVREAIGETHMVLELIGTRYADHTKLPFVEFLADSINNQGLFVGPRIPNPFELSLDAFKITIDAPSGAIISYDGRHPNGHPVQPLLWLANFFSGRGEDALKKGMIITTGSYAGVLEMPMDTPLTIAYEGVGKMQVVFRS
jgi:2-keto-4-pentenoate hydratase